MDKNIKQYHRLDNTIEQLRWNSGLEIICSDTTGTAKAVMKVKYTNCSTQIKGKVLELFETKVTVHPGKTTFDCGTKNYNQPRPLFQEKQGCQFAFTGASDVIVDCRVSIQDVVDHLEHAPIEISGIGLHHEDVKPI